MLRAELRGAIYARQANESRRARDAEDVRRLARPERDCAFGHIGRACAGAIVEA